MFDRLLTGVGALTGLVAIWVFVVNVISVQRPRNFTLLGGPPNGEYETVAEELSYQFNGLRLDRGGPPNSNPIDSLGKLLFDPERNLTMSQDPIETNGSESNFRLIGNPEAFKLGNLPSKIKLPKNLYPGDPIIGFCQDQALVTNTKAGKQPGDTTVQGQLTEAESKIRALAPAYTSNLYIFVNRSQFAKELKGEANVEFRSLIDRRMKPGESRAVLFGSAASYQAFDLVLQQYLEPTAGIATVPDLKRAKLATQGPGVNGVPISPDYLANLRAVSQGTALACVALAGAEAGFLRQGIGKDIALVEIDRADAIVQRQYGYKSVTIPAASIPGADAFPATGVRTIGAPEILACNDDLSDKDAFDIVRRLSLLPSLKSWLTNMSDAWDSPESATYIPMHPGALQFFRKQGAPKAVDLAVLSFASMCLGSFLAYMKRRRIREELVKLDRIIDSINKGNSEVVMDASTLVEIVKFEALGKLKLGLIDDSQYGCVEKYGDFANQIAATKQKEEKNGGLAVVQVDSPPARTGGES